MFTGSHIHTIDEKGRVVLPAGIRKQFEGHATCYIALGTDGQITLNRPDEFETYMRQVAAAAKTKKERALSRDMAREAVEQKLDKAGRILVPELHRQYAQITVPSEVVVSGAITHAEIWNLDLAAADSALGRSALNEPQSGEEANDS